MEEHALIGLATIIVVGIAAQWVAWRVQFPSILLLLISGFVLGPVTGIIEPNEMFGNLLMPIVSVSVAIILFEGGLSLRLSELREVGRVVRDLVSVGIVVTWALIVILARYVLGFDFGLALLLGAILVVTGPTVVGPLLLHIRPKGQTGPILKWEGILNDAIGAVLAVLVFEALISDSPENAPLHITTGIVKTLAIGVIIGVFSAAALVQLIRRHWIPDYLDNPVTLAIVVGAFALSNHFQSESGLLTVTLMGIVVANQPFVAVRHLVEFKENLRVLLLSVLFVVLAARLHPGQLDELGVTSILFVAALILVVRPCAVFACTWRSKLSLSERLFLCLMAPRGIVAAAVSSVFAIRLGQENFAQADRVVPIVFLVITVTVAFYGLSARSVARWLGLAAKDRQGIVIVGAHALGRQIAKALKQEGFKTLLIDSNGRYVTAARLADLEAQYGDALSERLVEELDLTDMGKLLALTANDHVNTLAALHFAEVFGRNDVYELAPEGQDASAGAEDARLPKHLRGRTLFGPEQSHTTLTNLLRKGAVVKVTKLTEEFDYDAYLDEYGTRAVPMFIVTEDKKLKVKIEGGSFAPVPGQKVISLVQEESEPGDSGQRQ